MSGPYGGNALVPDRYSGRRDPDRVAARGTLHRCPPPAPPLWSLLVITATDLELRAGSRILLSDATLRVQPGDRIGLVGRNGAGKTTTMRVLAGEGEPYAGAVTANEPDRLPARRTPARATSPSRAKDRVLSARGLDEMLRKMEKAQTAMAELVDGAQNEQGRARVRAHRGAVLRARRVRRGERRRPDLRPPRAARPRARPADRHAVGRPAPPRGAGPDPVRRLRRRGRGRAERHHPAARRAHQPPRRRLDHLAALVPVRPRAAGSS